MFVVTRIHWYAPGACTAVVWMSPDCYLFVIQKYTKNGYSLIDGPILVHSIFGRTTS